MGWLRDPETGQFVNAVTSKRLSMGAPAPVRPADAGLPPLPIGWACHIDVEDACAWYSNLFTSESQWERPTQPGDAMLPSLPPGWRLRFDQADNMPYYVNAIGESQWERPPPLSQADPAPGELKSEALESPLPLRGSLIAASSTGFEAAKNCSLRNFMLRKYTQWNDSYAWCGR